MKQDISFYGFTDAFRSGQYKDNFSVAGLRALYDYLEEMFEDDEYTLDVVALCCEYSEYADIEEFKRDYPNTVDIDKADYEEDDDIEQYEEDFIEELRNHTIVIDIEDTDGFIIQCF